MKLAVEHHRRTGQDVQVIAREVQVADAQAVELQEVLAKQRAVVVQGYQAQLIAVGFDRNFK